MRWIEENKTIVGLAALGILFGVFEYWATRERYKETNHE